MTEAFRRKVSETVKVINVIVAAGVLSLAASFARPAAANETLEGSWEGHVVSVGAGTKIPESAAFNWGAGKWNFNLPSGTYTSYKASLDLSGTFRDLSGTYSTQDKANAAKKGVYEISGNFAYEKKLLVWQPERRTSGNLDFAKTVIRSMTYSEDGTHEYLKGRWAAKDGTTGAMVFRRDYDGNPLKDDAVKSEFLLPEADHPYEVKFGDFFLALKDDKSGITSKKDADEDHRKWKFEAAPDGYPKAFRIVPLADDGKCLEPTSDDSGGVALKDKADDRPEGEQFWRLERVGEKVLLVPVKYGGRALYIEDEGSGETIIRSRNESHQSVWALEKL